MPVEFNFKPFVALGQALADADGLQLKVGVVGDKASEKEDGSDLSLGDLALIHEYGNDHVPERAPVRKTFVAMQDELVVDARKIAFALFNQRLDPRKGLAILGQKVSARIKLTITSGLQPPNAASTIRRKGSSKPLIDDGQLVNAYSYVIEESAGAAAAVAAIADAGQVAA